VPRATPLLVLLVLLAAPIRAGSLTGPILDEGLAAEVVDVVQLPATGSSPLTRINVLREAPDGSARLFVSDLRGPLYVIANGTPATYLDMAAEFPDLKASPGLASGFVSFAFHPDFAINGIFYTVHTENIVQGTPAPNLVPPEVSPVPFEHHSVLTEFTATSPAAGAFNGTRRELMRVAAVHRFHNLGEIGFDPAKAPGAPDFGLLYIGSGDFGSVATGQPEQLQRLDSPYGAVLRIDPGGGPFMRGGITYDYGIPLSNPFVDDPDPDTLDEIYVYGARNAHRLTWDPGGLGTLLLSDIGQGNVEELNIAGPGANYGWPEREGTFALDVGVDPETVFALPIDDAQLGYTYPAAQFDHEDPDNSGVAAIAGAVVYRGAGPLHGSAIIGDIATGRLWYARIAELLAADDGDPSTTAQLYRLATLRDGQELPLLDLVNSVTSTSRADLRLHTGLDGTLYVTTKGDGFVRRLVPEAQPIPGLPALGLLLLALALAAAGGLSRGRLAARGDGH
jgi:glucose/arabinose dehydrogenase